MVQMTITDGGIVSQPTRHFRENEPTYRYIEERLRSTREGYLDADRETRLRLLFDSATYALLTANVPLYQADTSFEIYVDHYPTLDPDEMSDDMKDAGVGFHTRRPQYIRSNYDRLDSLFSEADTYLRDGDEIDAQKCLMSADGLGPAKSAFALAMLGWTDHVCLDTHVCQQLGVDPRDYEKMGADEYRALARDAFQQVPELDGEISPFLLQWCVFDLNREEIETHDDWFVHVDRRLRE